MVLSPRQQLILRKVVELHTATGLPVGSKTLAADPDVDCGPSTVRNELAILEERGLLAHPHTSAGRVPTDSGHRFYVDQLLPVPGGGRSLELQLVRREVDEAMRVTTETLSQVTNLLAIVSAPPIDTATIRHVEVLLLQPQVLMVVVITSTGGVTKKVFTFDRPIDQGLAAWAGAYLNERLEGIGLGARTLHARLRDAGLEASEQAFIDQWGSALGAYGHTFAAGAPGTSAAEIGAATAIEFGPGGQLTAVAEPVRRGGGSARVVHPAS